MKLSHVFFSLYCSNCFFSFKIDWAIPEKINKWYNHLNPVILFWGNRLCFWNFHKYFQSMILLIGNIYGDLRINTLLWKFHVFLHKFQYASPFLFIYFQSIFLESMGIFYSPYNYSSFVFVVCLMIWSSETLNSLVRSFFLIFSFQFNCGFSKIFQENSNLP